MTCFTYCHYPYYAVAKFRAPRTQKELKSLIGTLSYFRKFIPLFAEHVAPLHELTREGESVSERWGEKHQKALDTVKRLLTASPILAAPQFGRPFRIEADASKIAIGACLMQRDEGGLYRPVCYASRKLNRHERNYTIMELEALAILFGMLEFRMFTEGSGTIDVQTDNSTLRTVLRKKDLSGRMARFQLALQGYDYKVSHRPGATKRFCDYLSRWLGEEDKEEGLEEVINAVAEEVLSSPRDELRRLTAEDPVLEAVRRLMANEWRETNGVEEGDEEAKVFRSVQHELEERDGVIERDGRVVVPKVLREKILVFAFRVFALCIDSQ